MKRLSTLIFLITIVSQTILAQTIAVQGVLRDPAGRTVVDGSHTVVFKLYDAETGGSELWSESHGSVTTSHGVFSEKLGESSSMASLSFTEQYWLGIRVDDGTEISQRLPLQSSPAANAVTGSSNIFPSTGNVGIGTTDPQAMFELNGALPYINFEDTDGGSSWLMGNYGTDRFLISENGTDARLVVQEGGNVGIGTTDPTASLHVVGTARVEGVVSVTDRFRMMREGANYLEYNNAHSFHIRSATADDNEHVNKMTLTAAGDVGIGTDAPSELLDVAGNLKISNGGVLIFQDGTSLASAELGGSAASVANSASAIITADSDEDGTGDIQFKTGVSTDMVITNAGDVGVNSSAPDAKLSIDSDEDGSLLNVHSRHASDSKIFEVEQVSTDGRVSVRTGGGTTITQLSGYSGAPSYFMSKVGIGVSVPAYQLEVDGPGVQRIVVRSDDDQAGIEFESDGTGRNLIYSPDGSDDLQFWSTASGDHMRLTATGYLGIGTTSPSSMLHVVGASYFEDRLRLMRTAGDNYIDFYSGRNLHFRSIGTDDSDGNTRVTIGTNGFLGIGTTTPDYPLHILASQPYLKFTDTDGGSEWSMGNYGGNRFLIQEGSSDRLVIQEGGNVGINNNAPDAKLSIDSDGDGSLLNVHSSHASDSKIFEVEESGSDGLVSIRTGSGTTVTQLSGYSGTPSYFKSRVGIGTTAPNADLELISAGEPIFRMGQNTNSVWDVRVNTAFRKIKYNGSTVFEFHSNGNAWMAGSLGQNSDRRLKRNINTVVNALNKVMSMRGVSYNWNQVHPNGLTPDTRLHYGFVAQEMEDVLPEIVVDNTNGYKTISYSEVSSVLVEAIKEQQSQIESQQATIQALMDRLAQVEASLENNNR
ncbi:MAG: tail fiber domain-containing protein [Candidatus Marinimicrobia bacterium]|nr:tail fiber domain-containing protein [Candidatus Neomarinimicrobiota bacterium]